MTIALGLVVFGHVTTKLLIDASRRKDKKSSKVNVSK